MQTYFRTQSIGSNKRARTRGMLIDSAIEVFSTKGIEDASINEITAMAGMANGTFYNHFKDKDDVAYASTEAIALEIAKQLNDRMNDLDQGVSRVVVASWSFICIALAARPWGRVLVSQYQRRPVAESSAFEYMRGDIQRAVTQRNLDVTVDWFLLEQIAALMMTALRGMLGGELRTELLARTCENILRLLGMTPLQAKRELARVSRHALLDPNASGVAISSEI